MPHNRWQKPRVRRNPGVPLTLWLDARVRRYLSGGTGVVYGPRVMAHLIEKQFLLRANTALLLTLVWGGLAACAFGAVIFDLGRLLHVW